MGWIDTIKGQLIAIDTAPLIYFIEESPVYLPVVLPFFKAFPLTVEIAAIAADLRAQCSLRTPDAVQMATAIYAGAQYFLTNDTRLPDLPNLRRVLLDDCIH